MTATALALETARARLAPWAATATQPEPDRLEVPVPAADLVRAAQALAAADWGRLAAITGLDSGGPGAPLEVLYPFCAGSAVVTLRVAVDRAAPVVPSLAAVAPAAGLYERELMEMFGVTVSATPNPERLYLSADWPAEVYPLRKAAVLPPPPAAEDPLPAAAPPAAGTFILPIGPQHPALKEPGHFEFTLAGEVVTAASVRLGYVHRGIEKATEARTWTQNLYLLERVCGICSHIHATAFALGVERLAGVEAPPRAQAIRTLLAELERIHSHLLWLGVTAHQAGFDALFMYAWRDRETVMDLLEQLSGNRVHYAANVLGGVKFDVTPEQAAAVGAGLDFLEERTRHYLEVIATDAGFLQRTRGIGVLPAALARQLGVVGPTARASGVLRDVRTEAPYAGYAACPVAPVLLPEGDLAARCRVRLAELLPTYAAVRALLADLPAGPLAVRVPRKLKASETLVRVEAPRGELCYFLKSNGSEQPERVHIATPTIRNLNAALVLVVGQQLADVPMLLAGVDLCFSCNDRAVVVAAPGAPAAGWTWEQVRRHGLAHYAARDRSGPCRW